MRYPLNREELIHEVVTRAGQGMSRRAIARALGVSRNTVLKIALDHVKARAEPHDILAPPAPRAPREKKVDAFCGRIDELLARYPDITAQRVFEELCTAGYDGKYTAVKEHVRKVRPKAPPAPSLPTVTYGPGEMAENDWATYRIDFTAGPSGVVNVFGYTLCFSRRKTFLLYERADLHALMDGHVATFDRLGGAAHKCKYDGQKAVILGWEAKQPLFNPRFLAFATHYDFQPVACRPYHPNDKPRVERSFWEFQCSFLRGRSFRDLDDMRAQLALWQTNTCDVRPLRKRKRTRMELFAEEGPKLQALPCHPYDTARVVYRVCSVDGFVSWDGNRYAVPYEHITEIVPVRVTQHEVLIYAPDLSCIARHELAPRSAGADVIADYHPAPTWERRGADMDQLRQAFEDMGEGAKDYLASLCVASPRTAGYQARQILLLRETYCSDDLSVALSHARAFGAWEHQSVGRILEARHAPRRLAEYVAEDTARRVMASLGESETTARDLDEYDHLPLTPSPTPTEHPCPSDQPLPSPQTPTDCSPASDDPSNSSD